MTSMLVQIFYVYFWFVMVYFCSGTRKLCNLYINYIEYQIAENSKYILIEKV